MTPLSRWLRRLLPHGLLGRSLLILVTPLVVVQAVSAYVFYASHWDTIARRLANGLAGDIGVVAELLRTHPEGEARDHVLRLAAAKMELDMRVLAGAILDSRPKEPPSGLWENALFQALDERVQRPYRVDLTSFEREIAIRVQLADGLLEVFAPKKRLFSSTTYVFLMWMVGISVILLAVAVMFMRNQVRSVRKLAAAADAFGRGLDVPDFKPEGANEVRQAAHAFNIMRGRLHRQIQQRTEMLAGVSHDLRTPLTRMKLQLAMLGDAEGRAELEADVAEMGHMIEGYLAFARGEGGEKPVPCDLAALVEEVALRFGREGHAIDVHSEGALSMTLRPNAMARALTNLLANAARYGGNVWVRTGRRQDGAEILIDDDGPGIPADRRDDVFRPFTRLESSRNLATGGVGLGLTIARDFIHAHGGEIFLEDSPLGGLRVRVRLPL